MKAIITTIIALIPFLIFAQLEEEPNNSFSVADKISFGDTIEAFIAYAGDDDYFAFEIPEDSNGGMITATILSMPGNLDLNLKIYNHAFELIYQQLSANHGQGYSLDGATCLSGANYVMFEDGAIGSGGGSSFNEDEPYKIRIDFIPFNEIDQCECENESLNESCEIESGEVVKAVIAPRFGYTSPNSNITIKDKDFYKILIDEPSIVKLDFQSVPSNLELETFFFHPNQEEFWSEFSKNSGEAYSVELSSCEVGYHYVLIKEDDAAYNIAEQYEFVIDIIPFSSVDNYECNNTFNNAAKIELCDTVNALFNPWFGFNDGNNLVTKDEDHYEIYLEANTEYNIQVKSISDNVELCFSIHDDFFEQLKAYNKNAGQPLNINFTPEETATYYIKIKSCDFAFDTEMQYQMTFNCDAVSSIKEEDSGDIVFYPNPFENFINIDLQNFRSNEWLLEIFDISGNLLLTQSLEGNHLQQINLSRLSTGMFFVKVTSNGLIFTEKIVKN